MKRASALGKSEEQFPKDTVGRQREEQFPKDAICDLCHK